ncbi:MAG: hypothetical protein WCD69_17790 [Xanthobacteraceae bacterium]
MTVTTLKNLTIVIVLLAAGAALAMIGFLTRQQIITSQASAPASAPTAQHSTPVDQLVSEIDREPLDKLCE